MNGELEAWIARGVVSAVVATCVGLFVRTRKLEARAAVAEKTLGDLEERDTGAGEVAKLREEFQKMHLCIATNYIRREDWVPHISRVLGALEKHGECLARLEERTGAK